MPHAYQNAVHNFGPSAVHSAEYHNLYVPRHGQQPQQQQQATPRQQMPPPPTQQPHSTHRRPKPISAPGGAAHQYYYAPPSQFYEQRSAEGASRTATPVVPPASQQFPATHFAAAAAHPYSPVSPLLGSAFAAPHSPVRPAHQPRLLTDAAANGKPATPVTPESKGRPSAYSPSKPAAIAVAAVIGKSFPEPQALPATAKESVPAPQSHRAPTPVAETPREAGFTGHRPPAAQPQERVVPSDGAEMQSTLHPSDFALEAVLGIGAYGKVFKVTSKHTGRPFALKVIDKARLKTGKPTVPMLVKEANLLRLLDHPYIVKLHATFQTADKVFYLTDLLGGGDCFRHEQLRGFSEAEARHLAAQAVLALNYMHSRGVLYRDMKPENCALDASGNLVLIDMGHGIQQATATDLAGTPEYMAPEQIYQRPHDTAVDYWGLGITLYELMARRHPFGRATPQQILTCEPPYQFPQPVGRACIDFLSGLLRKDPRQRLTDFTTICAHPWFRTVDWKQLANKQSTPPYRPSTSLWQNFDPEFLSMSPVLETSEPGPHIPAFNFEPPSALALVKGDGNGAAAPAAAAEGAPAGCSRPATPAAPAAAGSLSAAPALSAAAGGGLTGGSKWARMPQAEIKVAGNHILTMLA